MVTYYGHVQTPADAVRLFEACRLGILPRVQCRLSYRETASIKSGSVFVWDTREAGIKRWTDGKMWSASRVSGSFLTYREVEGRDREGQFRRRRKYQDSRRGSDDDQMDIEEPAGYRVKPDGLVKRLFSLKTATGKHLHLISYYTRQHLASRDLQLPMMDPKLSHIRPAKEMYPASAVRRGQLAKSSPYMPLAHERLQLHSTPPGHSQQTTLQEGCQSQDYTSPQTPATTPSPTFQSPCQSQPRSKYTPIYENEQSPRTYKAEGSPYDRSTPPLLNLPLLPPSPASLPPIYDVRHTTVSPHLKLLLLPPTPDSLPPINGARNMTTSPLPNLILLSPSPTPVSSRRCSPTPPSVNSISYIINSTGSFPGLDANRRDSRFSRIETSTESGKQRGEITLAREKVNAWVEDQRVIGLLDRTIVF